MRRAAAVLLSLALLTSAARAQDSALVLDLGGGATVTRVLVHGFAGATFQQWAPSGFTFGGSAQLARQARWFARVRTGRIVAAVAAGPQTYGWRTMMGRGGIAYTDDLGEHWQLAALDAPAVPTVIAFDPASTFGVAVGDGHVWSTDDGGTRWRERRSDDARYVGVVVSGRAIVLRRESGDVLYSRDGTLSLRTLATDAAATAEMDGDVIVVRAGGRTWRALPNGDLRVP